MSETPVEQGIVTEIRGDKALVKIIESGSCDKCGAKLFCKPGKSGAKEMLALNSQNAQIGDSVNIEDASNLMLKVSLIQFGLPLLGLIIGIMGANLFNISLFSFPSELTMFLFGLTGVALCGVLGRGLLKRMVNEKTCFFEVTRILS